MQREIERRRLIETELDGLICCSLRPREVHLLTIAARMVAERRAKNKSQRTFQKQAINHILKAVKCIAEAQKGD